MPRRWQVWISRSTYDGEEVPCPSSPAAVGQHEVRPRAELLDEAEDVVPAPAVQSRGVIAQLVEDLVHLERREDRLDEHRGADRSVRNAERPAARGRRRRSRAAPRGATPSSADKSTDRCRARSAPSRCERSRAPKSKRLAETGSPSTSRCFSEQMPAARPDEQRRGLLVERCTASRRVENEIVRRTASRRLSWPSMLFAQVGEFASSKSAMKTFAPEFSALMIILRSTGPVISTRRSSRSSGIGATVQSDIANVLRLRQKVRQLAGVDAQLALLARRQQLLAPAVELPMQPRHERQRLVRKDVVPLRPPLCQELRCCSSLST